MQPLEKRLPRSKKSPEQCVVEFFESYQREWQPGDRCLELGVGEGRQLNAPARYGFGLHGIDIDPLAIELSQHVIAERGIEAEIVLGEIGDLPYPDNHFRVVYAPSLPDAPEPRRSDKGRVRNQPGVGPRRALLPESQWEPEARGCQPQEAA
jgi:hypothetical protein